MGIKGLMKVITENAPDATKESTLKGYFGRKIAIDASMCLYQFLIAVRLQDGSSLAGDDGEVTSHLQGMFYRTMRLLDHGIKPVFVFDGKPPQLKFEVELKKRAERREAAEADLKLAQEEGNQEEVEKFERRLVRVTKDQNREVQRLLTLMGIPWIEAPSEAEALCAELTKRGHVYATATEDMDALTFGTTRLVRNLLAAESRKLPVLEVSLEKVLGGLGMNQLQFVDFCVLLGCDYTSTIPKVGPAKSIELITTYGSIKDSLPHLGDKYVVPEDFHYKEAADLFIEPEVGDVDGINFEWKLPDEQGLVDFLVTEKAFDESRVRGGIKRILDSRKHMQQQRLESFFKPQTSLVAKTVIKNPAKIAAEKRAVEEAEKKKLEAAQRRKQSAQKAAEKRKATTEASGGKPAKKQKIKEIYTPDDEEDLFQ